jgi:hypothetical protein
MLAADAQQQGVAGEHLRAQPLHRDPDRLGVDFGRRLAVELPDDALLGIGIRDHEVDLARHEVLEHERSYGSGGPAGGEHGGIGQEAAIEIDLGLLETQIVAGRTTNDRHIVERLVQGGSDPFLHHGQPVDDQEPEGVGTGQTGPFPPEGGRDADGLILIVGQGVDQVGHHPQAAAAKADGRHAAPLETAGADLAGGTAADHGTWKGPFELASNHLQVVQGGTEQENHIEFRATDLGGDLRHRGGGVDRHGHSLLGRKGHDAPFL